MKSGKGLEPLPNYFLEIKLKIVQTGLDKEEYELLKELVDSKGITMKESLTGDGVHGAVKQK